MKNLQQNRALAYEIGLCRIAMVVDRFHNQVKTHPRLGEWFGVSTNWGDQRARLTYFWWVVLGGKKLRAVDFDLIPERVRAGIKSDELREWLALFRLVAVPILGEEFANAWTEKAERLGRRLLVSNDEYVANLAKAS